MGAIDFRFRPVGTQSITRDLTFEYLRKMGLAPAPSFERQDLELMFREMDEAGIEMGVIGVPAPTDKQGFESTGNAAIADMVRRLTLIIQHGAWPYSREACGLAYKEKNEGNARRLLNLPRA